MPDAVDAQSSAPRPAGRPADERRVVFLAGGARFALPLDAVREVVVPRPPFARVPRAGAPVRGAMNLRGRVVAVVDLAPLLGLPPEHLGEGQGHVLLLLDRSRGSLGLLVQRVLGVEGIDAHEPAEADGAPLTARVDVEATRTTPAAQGPEPTATVLDIDALEARAAALVQGAA